MKWIILAGWSWTRLYPITKWISKQLIPVYNKPMIYYPLSVLMMWGIKEILIISTPEHLPSFKKLLWDWSSLWCKFTYKIQPNPGWLAEAFILGEEFIWNDSVCLILWDNIFYSDWLMSLIESNTNPDWWVIFWYHVPDPERFWVVEYDEDMNVISLEEKPKSPKSNYAVPWLYFYDNSVIEIAKKIKPSARWELEITSINEEYLKLWKLKAHLFGRWSARFDTWTFSSLSQAGNFIELVEKNQWVMIGSPEEIAYHKWFINKEELREIASWLLKNSYGEYLMNLIKK